MTAGQIQPGPPPTTRYRGLLRLVLLFALALRLGHFAALRDGPMLDYPRLSTESDMHIFDAWARRIVAGDLLGREPFRPLVTWQLAAAPAETWDRWLGDGRNFLKAPLYPYLLAALMALFGQAMAPVALLQICASVLAVWLLHDCTRRLLGADAALLAALWFATYGPAVHYDVVMLRGPLIVLVCLLSSWHLARIEGPPGRRAALVAGGLAGLCLLLYEGLLLLPPLVALGLAVRSGTWRAAARSLLGFGLGLALVLSPLVARNLAVGTSPLALAANGAPAFAMCNSAAGDPFFFDAGPEVFVPVLQRSGGGFLPTVLASLRSFESPAELAQHYAVRLAVLVAPVENIDNVSPYYAALRSPVLSTLPGWAWLLPAAALGAWLARARWRALWPLWLPLLAQLGAILFSLPMSRYRAALAVFLMPLAGLAAARVGHWAQERRWRALGLAAAGTAGLALLAHWAEARLVFDLHPRDGFVWRPYEFVLGLRFYAEQQRLAELAREGRDLARLCPVPLFRPLGLLAAGRAERDLGNLRAERAYREAAFALGADRPDLLLEIGEGALSLGDPALARYAWELALPRARGTPLEATVQARLAGKP